MQSAATFGSSQSLAYGCQFFYLSVASQSKVKVDSSLAELVLGGSSIRIRRPPNAFMIYARDHRKLIANQNPDVSNKSISTILGNKWKNLDGEAKEKYFDRARLMDRLHKQKYPTYVYNPKEARQRKAKRLCKRMMRKGILPGGVVTTSDANTSKMLPEKKNVNQDLQFKDLHQHYLHKISQSQAKSTEVDQNEDSNLENHDQPDSIRLTATENGLERPSVSTLYSRIINRSPDIPDYQYTPPDIQGRTYPLRGAMEDQKPSSEYLRQVTMDYERYLAETRNQPPEYPLMERRLFPDPRLSWYQSVMKESSSGCCTMPLSSLGKPCADMRSDFAEQNVTIAHGGLEGHFPSHEDVRFALPWGTPRHAYPMPLRGYAYNWRSHPPVRSNPSLSQVKAAVKIEQKISQPIVTAEPSTSYKPPAQSSPPAIHDGPSSSQFDFYRATPYLHAPSWLCNSRKIFRPHYYASPYDHRRSDRIDPSFMMSNQDRFPPDFSSAYSDYLQMMDAGSGRPRQPQSSCGYNNDNDDDDERIINVCDEGDSVSYQAQNSTENLQLPAPNSNVSRQEPNSESRRAINSTENCQAPNSVETRPLPSFSEILPLRNIAESCQSALGNAIKNATRVLNYQDCIYAEDNAVRNKHLTSNDSK